MEFSKISLASQKFIPAFMLYMLVDVCDNHPLTIRLSVFKYLRDCSLVFSVTLHKLGLYKVKKVT